MACYASSYHIHQYKVQIKVRLSNPVRKNKAVPDISVWELLNKETFGTLSITAANLSTNPHIGIMVTVFVRGLRGSYSIPAQVIPKLKI